LILEVLECGGVHEGEEDIIVLASHLLSPVSITHSRRPAARLLISCIATNLSNHGLLIYRY
jgi:hypothetical protein